MTLSIKNDHARAGGGYALLEGPALAGVTAIAIENCASGQYLGEDGRWKKTPFAFPVEATPSGALSLGPHIVDYVPTELLVALHTGDGTELGKLFWSDVLPSRNRAPVTSAEVFEERRRRAEAGAAETARRIAEEEAARKAAADEAAARQAADDAARRAAEEQETARRAAEVAARRQAEQEDAARRAAAAAGVGADKKGPRPSRGPWIAIALFVLLLGAGAAIAFALGVFKPSETRVAEQPQQPERVPQRQETPSQETPRQETPRQDPPRQDPPRQDPPKQVTEVGPRTPPVPVDCERTFAARLDTLSSMADAAKVRLGNEALQAGCGDIAFKAFNDSDWQNDEDAAWNLARFYDPNETRLVYRSVATVHPDWAAAYYHEWRSRSPRHAAALAKICAAANSGSASLQRACVR